MKALVLGLAAAMAVGVAGARADEAQVSRDVRCLAVVVISSGVLMSRDEPEMKTLGLVTATSSLYYLGRLEKDVPIAGLADRMRREVEGMSQGQLQSEAIRCSAELKDIGEKMQALGQDLTASAAGKGI